MEIQYSHPDEGLYKTINALKEYGVDEDSRNGPVRRFPEPVMLINLDPCNRVSTSPIRDANPFFHFMEALWMLAGMNDLDPIAKYNSGIRQYSDDGDTLRGTAYGYKWRKHFGYDQLELAVARLRENPQDRRVVMTMWDPTQEWRNPNSKDLSCNLQVIFGTRSQDGRIYLDMEVTNRSNDIVYGCLGSNVFHFSYLLEYVAWRTGFKVGRYYQVAFNLHGYLENATFRKVYDEELEILFGQHRDGSRSNETDQLTRMGLPGTYGDFTEFVRTGDPGDIEYLQKVGVPLYEAYNVFKLKSRGIQLEDRIETAQAIASQCADYGLAIAAVNWLGRRKK